MTRRPLIYIGNDDGIDARGIHALAEFVADLGDVYVVAPREQQSAKSSAISFGSRLYVEPNGGYPAGITAYSAGGTPVDCAKLGFHSLLPRRPDLVLSGINHGSNLGINTLYSGTMGVVVEGCLLGVPSIGFSYTSHDTEAPLEHLRDTIRAITGEVLARGLPAGVCLNVNIPADTELRGMRVGALCPGYWTEEFIREPDEHGRDSYLLSGTFVNTAPDDPTTDVALCDRGYVAIAPVLVEQTAREAIAPLSERFNR